jgi:hypothetical protein
MTKKMKKGKFIIGGIFLGTIAITAFTFATMLLWNWLMPAIFALGTITFWQALGLLALSKILFSGFGHAHRVHDSRRKKYWNSKFEEKWQNMPRDKRWEYWRKAKGAEMEVQVEEVVTEKKNTED